MRLIVEVGDGAIFWSANTRSQCPKSMLFHASNPDVLAAIRHAGEVGDDAVEAVCLAC